MTKTKNISALKQERLDKILKFLDGQPKNRVDIKIELNIHQSTIDCYMTYLHDMGLIHVHHYVPTDGKPTPYWTKKDVGVPRGVSNNTGKRKNPPKPRKEIVFKKPKGTATWFSSILN